MKRIFVFIVSLLVLLMPVYGVTAKTQSYPFKIDKYTLSIGLIPNPPVVGENRLVLEIKNPEGKIANDCEVNLLASMPGMEGMAPERAAVKRSLAKGYEAEFQLSMGGMYNLTLGFGKKGSSKKTLKLSIVTGEKGIKQAK